MGRIAFFYIIIGIFIVIFFILALWTIWLFREWRLLEIILKKFQNKDSLLFEEDSTISNISLKIRRKQKLISSLQETRQSKLVSELEQILNRASWQEEQAKKEKNQVMKLISDLSHQLKTPLANIILDTELLESDELKEEQRKEFLHHAKAQAARMQWLMQNLLKASRLENGMIQFQAENTGIKATIVKAVNAVYAQAREKKIEIFMEEFKDIVLFHNPKWTVEAMINVLENAVKYSKEKSKIKISMMEMDIYTRITIHDQGMGIPQTEYNKIFQRFYRGKQAQEEEGTGLGLYLAQLILQSEQGYLTVDSKLGKGSSFHFFLLNRNFR